MILTCTRFSLKFNNILATLGEKETIGYSGKIKIAVSIEINNSIISNRHRFPTSTDQNFKF